jgi:hypothetical protein
MKNGFVRCLFRELKLSLCFVKKKFKKKKKKILSFTAHLTRRSQIPMAIRLNHIFNMSLIGLHYSYDAIRSKDVAELPMAICFSKRKQKKKQKKKKPQFFERYFYMTSLFLCCLDFIIHY